MSCVIWLILLVIILVTLAITKIFNLRHLSKRAICITFRTQFINVTIVEDNYTSLFNQVAIKPAVWGEPTDDAVVESTIKEDVPLVLDYLETQVATDGFIFGEVSIADISIACFFRNAAFARFSVDAVRWPRTASFVERVLKLESFEKLKPIEDRLRRTPVTRHRTVVQEMGIPVTQESLGTLLPRRGVMRID